MKNTKTHYQSNKAVIRNGVLLYVPRCRQNSTADKTTPDQTAVTCGKCREILVTGPLKKEVDHAARR